MITPLNNLTNEELLRTLGPKRHHSPVIEELCKRLEKAVILLEKAVILLEKAVILDDFNGEIHCPACQATIKYSSDDSSELVVEL